MSSLSLKWKQRIFPRIVAYVAKGLMRLVMMTCKVRVTGLEHFKDAARGKCILAVWHNRVTLIPEIMSRATPEQTFAGFVSNSRDGEIIAAITESYSIGETIRISHDSKGEGLRKMINHLKFGKNVIVVTPDGPKGPLYEVKPGIAKAAFEAGATVVSMCWEGDKLYRLKSWDKMLFPKPFSTIEVQFSKGVVLEQEDPKVIEEAMLSITALR